MSDKTEILVDLEVSGAEALCQTDDGYVWIAQYSGLTRYDSKECITYKSFEFEGTEYPILNVRALVTKNNILYIATSSNVFILENNAFRVIKYDFGVVRDIILDSKNDLLYVSTDTKGGVIYNIKDETLLVIPGTEEKSVPDIVLDEKNNSYYYQLVDGVYNKDGEIILADPKILDIYSYDNIIYIGLDNGVIHRYDMDKKDFLDDIIVSSQVNKMLYNPDEKILFVACEKIGLFCVDLSEDEPKISVAGDLKIDSQLVDLMIDYQGNLWIASHYTGTSGVSIITKNALYQLLYDDANWQGLEDKNVFAVEKYEDMLYIATNTDVHMYDLNTKKIIANNPISTAIKEYANTKTIEGKAEKGDNYVFEYHPKDVEIFKDKVFIAATSIGVLSYDPETEDITIYDLEYISNHHGELPENFDIEYSNTARSLRSFDDFLAIGLSRGIMKFDGEMFQMIYAKSSVVYIDKTKDGKVFFDRTSGLFVVDDEFKDVTEIPTYVTGNRLKFLVDGDYVYFTENSRLYRLEEKDGEYAIKEIAIPYVKGSIVELSKIAYKNYAGETKYKYIIGSQTQIYITDTLDVDTLEEYEFYDSTNGLPQIIANTSGYYDEEEQLYYFSSTNGIFVYDFNETRVLTTPVKMAVSSTELDGKHFYGTDISIDKNVYRVAFNLSILGFKPNKGYSIYYKLDGIDNDYNVTTDDNMSIYYTNLPGGNYKFHVYSLDEYGQVSNEVTINLVKEKKLYEFVWFWIVIAILILLFVTFVAFMIIRIKTKQSLKKQLEYKNITVEAIQAIARTIDAKDEYTNGHSIRVGYYSKLIAENLGMSEDEVDNIYYIALLHDIGKIAIPDSILNKPGKLDDNEFKVMKSHTTRGARILKGISTIPQIIEGAKSHHEKYDGTGYPEGLKKEEIPFVARIICCADCFDAMASKRVYKKPYSLEKIASEFERCSGTQFDPKIAKTVVEMMESGKLKPYAAENTYLGEDGKTHRVDASKNLD